MAQAATLRRPKGVSAKRGAPKSAAGTSTEAPSRCWSHGQFHWNELRTRDAERAMKFYSDTIGWTFDLSCTPDGQSYWVAMQDGKPVAGLFQLVSPQFDSVPESWMSFLAVDDIDARVAKALAAGAKLAMPVFDVPNVGRIAMLHEPSGAGVGWITPVGAQAAKDAPR